MSIATTAPEKFALQDLACIDLMLRFSRSGSASFTIESGDEDADLVLGGGGETMRYEIQVKGAAGPVGVDELAEWLLHFPAYRHGDTALERLIEDPTRHFVLIASGRCRDDLLELVAAEGWLGEAKSKSSRRLATLVRDAFGRADPDGATDTNLHRRRIAHRDAAAKKLRVDAVARALGRVIVLEQATRSKLEDAIGAELVRRGLPSDQAAPVLAVLRGAVDAVRGSGADAMSLVEDYIRTASPSSLRPRNYEPRGDEGDLIDELERENRLLLSGIARSGKSTTARWIASSFQTRGFEVRRSRSLDEAEAFLDDPVPSLRLVILDDPLGGARPVQRRDEEALLRLERLVADSRADRRLVVSQGQERLLAVTGEIRLGDVLVGRAAWHDLSQPPLSFLEALWRRAAELNAFPAPLRDQVASALASGALALGAGALDFLARASSRLPANATLQDAIDLARVDAKSLGNALVSETRSATSLQALLLASEEGGEVDVVELAFVQGAGGDTTPGLATHLGSSFHIGAKRGPKPTYPDYKSPPATDADTRSDLDALERLHVLEAGQGVAVAFSHPFYREAIAATLLNPTGVAAETIMKLHRRALFAKRASTSRAAAGNLDLLLHVMSSRPDGRRLVFARAVEGLSSYFPTTRDLCFDFLASNLAEATDATAQPVVDWLHRVTRVDLDELEWRHGEAVLPAEGEVDDRAFMRSLRRPKRAAVASILSALDGGGPLPSPQDATRALRHLLGDPTRMTSMQIERLLSYREGVIRGAAARCWLGEPRIGDASVLARLRRDRHPLVAIGCLRGARESAADCAAYRRGELADLVAGLASTSTLALAMMDSLTIFERHQSAASPAAWRLFARVMAAAMRNLPVETRFDEARLYNVMDWARRRLPARRVVAIAAEWIAWLHRASTAGRHFGSFATGVVTILVAATRSVPAERRHLLATALGIRGTNAFLHIAADAVDEWDWLRDDERMFLTAVLAGRAPDARWRRAVALTREHVPSSLQAALLPPGVSLAQPATFLAAALPPQLLEACLAVHCANPSRLSAVSRRDRASVWEELAALVAADGSQPLLGIVFGHVADGGDGAKVLAMVAAGVRRDPEAVFALLMAETMHRDYAHLADAWQHLLNHAPSEAQRKRWLDGIAAASTRIFEVREDVTALIADPETQKEVWRRLPGDRSLDLIADVMFAIPGGPATKLVAKAYEALAVLLVRSPPKILGIVDETFEPLRRRFGLPADLAELVQSTRLEIIEESGVVSRRWNPERRPKGWIDPGSVTM